MKVNIKLIGALLSIFLLFIGAGICYAKIEDRTLQNAEDIDELKIDVDENADDIEAVEKINIKITEQLKTVIEKQDETQDLIKKLREDD